VPIDDRLRRLAKTVEPEVQRMLERHAAITRGYDELQHNPEMNIVGFVRMGETLFRAQTEHIGNYYPDIGMFRWAWALRPHTTGPTRLDAVMREGEAQGIEQLRANHISSIPEDDAVLVAHLAAHIARANGVLRLPEGEHFVFFALYEIPHPNPARGGFSVAPAAMPAAQSSETSLPALISDVTLAPQHVPPPAESGPVLTRPSAERPIREPGRLVLTPLAQQAAVDLARVMPGYTQALLVVSVNRQEAKGRFFVVLVATDAEGVMHALEPTSKTVEATANMIRTDSVDGNGPWRRLVLRFTPKPGGGAKLSIEIE
jgi:hypothetical protein